MQIHEITLPLNENALGAFGAGFAQGAGISVPDTGDAGGTVVSAYGDARQKAAAAAAKPMIAMMAKQEMQAWNMALADLLKKEKVIDRKQLSDASRNELARDLDVRLHKVLMQGNVGTNYAQDLPANVDQLSQPKAKALVDQLNAAKQAILNFDQAPATAAQQLAQWQALSQSAYDAMALTQFYPLKNNIIPKISPNPNGSYNIGSYRLTGDPADQLIAQRIRTEQEKSPNTTPQLKAHSDRSFSIGSLKLDPRNPDEAKAIAKIQAIMDDSDTAPAAGPAAPSPAASAAPKPGIPAATFNAQNIKNLRATPGSATMSNMANQLTRTATAESKRR